MIAGTVVINLATHDSAFYRRQNSEDRRLIDEDPKERRDADRYALMVLPLCPDGAHVEVNLGTRRYVEQQVAALLHEHDHRLQIEIRGSDPGAVAQLVRAARSGEWEVI